MDEQNIPIDINTTKLLDWLVSRRHVPKDWQITVLKVREKINNAIQDMPEHQGIVQLLSGQHINYFHCLKIVEILKETEKDSKNMFGRYGSQRMKDWLDVIALYQKDNVYLAEVATLLIRNVSYEIPGLKKQLQKLEQSQLENEKKIKDCNKSEAASLKEFQSACEQLGIKGENIRSELLSLLEELPKLYEETAEKIKIVQSAIEIYQAFNKFLSGQDRELLPTLSYLITHGNTTSYEYIYGEKPLSIEEPIYQQDVEIDFEPATEIDFEPPTEIDFGPPTEIDFGDQIIISPDRVEQNIDFGSSTGSSNEESFDFVNYDELHHLEESGIVVEGSGQDGGVARNEEALTILDHPKYRTQIIDDLTELEAFLKARLFEISHDADLLSMSQLQDAPSIVQLQTIETITTLIDCVNVALTLLTNKRVTHLHNIKHSVKYVDILTGSLKQKLVLAERMQERKQGLNAKRVETAKEIQSLEPLIKLLVDKTKGLQKEIEQDLSMKYKGRVVHIVGGVNSL